MPLLDRNMNHTEFIAEVEDSETAKQNRWRDKGSFAIHMSHITCAVREDSLMMRRDV